MITYLWCQIQLTIPRHCFICIECRHFVLFWKYVTWSLFSINTLVGYSWPLGFFCWEQEQIPRGHEYQTRVFIGKSDHVTCVCEYTTCGQSQPWMLFGRISFASFKKYIRCMNRFKNKKYYLTWHCTLHVLSQSHPPFYWSRYNKHMASVFQQS